MPEITPEDIQHTENLIGLEMTEDERELMLNGLKDLRQTFFALLPLCAFAPLREIAFRRGDAGIKADGWRKVVG